MISLVGEKSAGWSGYVTNERPHMPYSAIHHHSMHMVVFLSQSLSLFLCSVQTKRRLIFCAHLVHHGILPTFATHIEMALFFLSFPLCECNVVIERKIRFVVLVPRSHAAFKFFVQWIVSATAAATAATVNVLKRLYVLRLRTFTSLSFRFGFLWDYGASGEISLVCHADRLRAYV